MVSDRVLVIRDRIFMIRDRIFVMLERTLVIRDRTSCDSGWGVRNPGHDSCDLG